MKFIAATILMLIFASGIFIALNDSFWPEEEEKEFKREEE